jgi:hypothetical protein
LRNELLIDLLALLALAMIACGLFLGFGLAAALIFAGVVLLIFVLVFAVALRRGDA